MGKRQAVAEEEENDCFSWNGNNSAVMKCFQINGGEQKSPERLSRATDKEEEEEVELFTVYFRILCF